ncbi:MAG: CHC2 zinc finger domain-containing protein, partial [Gaiellales bacterium]
MAGRIRDEDVAAVRERTDIVKLVSGYLTLKKAGHDRFVGLCPFHTEKTPSFGVSPSKGLYHCFGCGKGGDAIGFLRDVEHLEFAEAVERLAKDAGVALRYEGDTPAERRVASKRQALVRANEAAFELYHR